MTYAVGLGSFVIEKGGLLTDIAALLKQSVLAAYPELTTAQIGDISTECYNAAITAVDEQIKVLENNQWASEDIKKELLETGLDKYLECSRSAIENQHPTLVKSRGGLKVN